MHSGAHIIEIWTIGIWTSVSHMIKYIFFRSDLTVALKARPMMLLVSV